MKRKPGWSNRHVEWVEKKFGARPLAASFFMCGVPEMCPKNNGGPHIWDGEGIEEETPEGGFMSAATCSKCGVDAMTHSLWNGP